MDKSFECVTHGPLYHGCIVSSCIAREVEIEKTESCRMVEGSGMKRTGKAYETGNQTQHKNELKQAKGARMVWFGQPISPYIS